MTTSPLSRRAQIGAFTVLAVLMAATRFHHFVPVPDASWAIFFAGGFYLAGASRWAFPLLMIEAVLVDYWAIHYAGVSDFCVTGAYGFLVPTHAVLWFGGRLLRGAPLNRVGLLKLAGCSFIATSLAYWISNTSFYWLGGRYAEPNLAQYLERFFMYYGHFLLVTMSYIAVAAVVHLGVVLGLRPSESRT